jgi:hypothetical protein
MHEEFAMGSANRRALAYRAIAAAAGLGLAFGLAAVLTAADASSDDATREGEVRRLLDRYFQSWSKADIARYGQCFMPQAAIQMIDPQGRLASMPLAPFLKSQQEAHRQSANGLTETAETAVIRFDGDLAHALVYWKLIDGQRAEYGYDHFTLMRSGGNWRIAHLIFYSKDQAPPRAP